MFLGDASSGAGSANDCIYLNTNKTESAPVMFSTTRLPKKNIKPNLQTIALAGW